MFKFEDLNVYKLAISFANEIYRITKEWPKSETYSLVDQLRRAAISISLNIAEGSGRTSKDFGHFISLSRGSCYECIAILTIAKGQNYVTDIQFQQLYDKTEVLAKMLTALKNSVR